MKCLLPIILLAGCAAKGESIPDPPKVVEVPVPYYVPIPPALTARCPVYQASEQTYAEAKRLALLRRESLEQCNRQLEAIEDLNDR